LRGLARGMSTLYAFRASIIDEEPKEIIGLRGIYSRFWAFECDSALIALLQKKDAIFRTWRAEFDKGHVDTSTHPLYVDSIYQNLYKSTTDSFSQLGNRSSRRRVSCASKPEAMCSNMCK
jgi:hypothetical protein